MNGIWSFRGAFVGALLGLLAALFVILARSSTRDNADFERGTSQSEPIGQGAPPIGSGIGRGFSVFERIADQQLELGQVDEAVDTICSAPSSLDIINYLKFLAPGRREMDSPSPAFPPALPVITADSIGPGAAPGPRGATPSHMEPQPRVPREFFLQVLDRLEERQSQLPLLPTGNDRLARDGTRPNSSSKKASAVAIQQEMRERVELEVAMAELYQEIDELESAKSKLAEAKRSAITFEETRRSTANQDHVIGASTLGGPDSALSPANDQPRDRKGNNHEWLFATAIAVLGTILGGVFKPVLEAYGKGVVGAAIADSIQSQEFANALNLKPKPVPSPSPPDEPLVDHPSPN
jgi:hypothetical protein